MKKSLIQILTLTSIMAFSNLSFTSLAEEEIYHYFYEYDNSTIETYNKTLELDNTTENSNSLKWDLYFNQRCYQNAIKYYTDQVLLDPYNVDAYYGRGIAGIHSFQYEAALADFETVLKFDPDNVESYYYRGFIYTAQSNYQKAIEDYTKVIELNPIHVQAYNLRAEVYDKLGDEQAANKDKEKAAELKLILSQKEEETSKLKKVIGSVKGSYGRFALMPIKRTF